MLTRLIYTSTLIDGSTVGDLNDIMDVSRKNNPQMGISGILCYSTRNYLQWLEGPREEVSKIYNRVASDKRHTNCTIIEFSEVQKREFGSWAMAFISSQGIDQDIWKRYMPTLEFNPYNLTEKNASSFLIEAAQSQKHTLGTLQKEN